MVDGRHHRNNGDGDARWRIPDGTRRALTRPPGRSRRRRRVAGTVTATLVAAATVATVTVVVVNRNHGSDTFEAVACSDRNPVTVVAAPDIAPVVRLAARAIGTTEGGCPLVAVTSQDPAETVSRLGRAGGSADASRRQRPPDVWVPSSSAWLRMAQTSQPGLFPTSGVSLARSPVVVAMTQPQAQALGWPATPIGWAELAAGTADHRITRLSVPSPLTSTVGMLTVLAANAAMLRSEPNPGIAAMRTLTLRSRIGDAEADLSALLRQMAGEPDALAASQDVGAFPLTEQQLWAYNREGRRAPLVGIYPRDATVEADYPLVLSSVVASDQRYTRLVGRLADWFGTEAGVRALTAHGFRRAGSGGSVPDGLGLADNYPRPTPLPTDPRTLLTQVSGWAGYRPLAFQVLVLVDGSGSMNSPVRDRGGRSRTKASLLREAGVQAGQLFGDETSVGLWEFSTHQPDTPYQEVVPYGPIDGPLGSATRRQVMVAAADRFQAFAGSGTPMYETVLRATAAMRDRYRSGAFSMVVVLTDGHDESSPYHMDTTTFLKRLSKVEDRARPVPIFSVGYGADADMSALTTMARATGGQAISSVNPSDLATAIARVFLAVHQEH